MDRAVFSRITSAERQELYLLECLVQVTEEQLFATRANGLILQQIADALAPARQPTPTRITFKETSMVDPIAGATLVYTGTISPDGSAFPAGTTFTASSSDPNVSASVDATGLIVTVVLGAGFTAGESDIITWQTSTFVASPSSSPTSLTATISITGVAAPVATPTAVVFAQTS